VRVTFLGGADEVGASCSLLEIDGRNILVDAGVRMSTDKVVGTPKDTLPDLACIADLGGVDVVLVTHAHLDHIGALPLIHQAYPKASVHSSLACRYQRGRSGHSRAVSCQRYHGNMYRRSRGLRSLLHEIRKALQTLMME
jgi:glyoxylase-like metal-dependent hydrolase (beta-lactamase superfamily II)